MEYGYIKLILSLVPRCQVTMSWLMLRFLFSIFVGQPNIVRQQEESAAVSALLKFNRTRALPMPDPVEGVGGSDECVFNESNVCVTITYCLLCRRRIAWNEHLQQYTDGVIQEVQQGSTVQQ